MEEHRFNFEMFTNVSTQKDSSFIQLDIKKLYRSVNEYILTKVIQFAKLHTTINDKNLD